MSDLQHFWQTDSNANMDACVCMQSSHTLQQKDRLTPDLQQPFMQCIHTLQQKDRLMPHL